MIAPNTQSSVPTWQTSTLLKLGASLPFAVALMWHSAAFATLADYQTAVTGTAGIISYFTFDQSNANDSVGTYNGSPENPAYAPGANGAGLGFLCDGNAQIDFGSNSDFEFPSSSGTIEAWVRADWTNAQSINPTLWADGDGFSTEYSVHMSGTATKNGIGIWNGASYDVLSIPAPGTNWHHLATVFDNGTFTVYWDGQFAATEFKVLGANPLNFELAASGLFSDERWKGMLDEVAIYSTALDSNTIQAHYQAFFAGTPPVIVKQPKGGTYLAGVTLQLSVSATGPNLTYQWFRGTSSLTGQTGSTLGITNLSAGNAGTYHVVVSNPTMDVPSDDATITIGTLPTQLSHYQTAVSNQLGLLSYYTFDKLTANDVFGPHNGTLQGSAVFAPGVGGAAGQGLLLDGSGQVNLGSTPDFAFTNSGNGSIEAWLRADWPDSFSSYTPTLFANRNRNGGLNDWSINMTANKQVMAIYNGSRSVLFSIPGGGAGTNWHHIAVVFDNNTNNTVYWDGVVAWPGTLAQSLGPTPSTTQIGSSSPASTTEGWIGRLDDVAVYSNSLSAAQVLAHYDVFYQDVHPVISVQPKGGGFLVGTSLSLNAQAQGADLVYQWYKDDVAVPGANTLSISTPSLDVTNSGVYYFTASNSVGVARSDDAVVSVGNNVGRYQAVVLSDPDLISYYTFDAGNAMDLHGTNNGTLEGSVSFSSGPGGATNKSLVLDGYSWVNMGQVSAFDFVSGGTVEAWIQPTWSTGYPLPDAPCLFADRNGGSVWSVHMTQGQDSIGNWNNDRFITLPISNTSGWHHFAITFGGGLVTMYWDGQAFGSFNQNIDIFSGETTQIGASDPSSPSQPWIGNLDEVAFYDTALSAAAINNHYLGMVGLAPAPRISFSLAGNQLTLTWPSDVTGYSLESTLSLSSPSWTPVGGVVNNSVTVTTSPGNKFFRLRKQ